MVVIPKYDPVGVCIYCGSDGGRQGLGKEHIVPFSLGGQAFLPEASCRDCEDITKKFERRCARSFYGGFRIRQNVQTRNKKERPTHLPVEARSGSKSEIIMMPVEALIGTLPRVHFLPPGILRSPPVKEVGWVGAELEVKTAPPRDNTAWANYPYEQFQFFQGFDLDAYALTLAKIAHAQAVASLGINAFEHWLPQYINGTDPALSYVVGGVREPLEPSNRLHDIQWTVAPHNGDIDNYLVTVRIRLFAQIRGPMALVVVGKSSLGFVQSYLVRDGKGA